MNATLPRGEHIAFDRNSRARSAGPKLRASLAAFLLVSMASACSLDNNEATKPADTATEAVADAGEGSASTTAEETVAEPVDSDGDGVDDEDDVRPKNPEVQSRDDLDTDRDGVRDGDDLRPRDPQVQSRDDIDTDQDRVPDYKDDFPKDAQYSKDSDGDRVADSVDDFPKDERYSKDSDGDNVADSKDVFPADPSRSKIAAAMENAIGTAESYLDFSAFSRSGLIEQLAYEGYATEDATFAVDHLNVDWNHQAVKSAKSYLDFSTFSLTGLIEQLQYEGFTYEQAAYGANKAY